MKKKRTKRSLIRRIPTGVLIFLCIVAAVFLAAAVKAKAQGAYCASWGERQVMNRDWPHDIRSQSYCRRWVRPAARVYGYERRDEPPHVYRQRWEEEGDARPHCPHPLLRVVGNQHLTVDGAKKAADEAWAGDVRFRHGEIFMDLNNARTVIYTCSRSSIKEAGVTTLGQTLTRCEIQATPCRAPRSKPLAPPQDRDDR